MQYLQSFIILCLLNANVEFVLNSTISSLMLVNVIFRHGDRTPTDTYKTDPYQSWPEGWGQLTNNGKNQMYTLGVLLRKQYNNFLSDVYYPEDLFVMSSAADRNIMSAQLVLAGLYPPVNDQIWNKDLLWQPIPVKYLPRNLDNIIAAKMECPAYDEAFNAAYESDRIKKIDDENSDLYEYLTKHSGQLINNIATLEALYNTFKIEMSYGLQLPEWTNSLPLQHMQNLAAENLAIYTDTTLMKRLKGGVLLKEIITRMNNKSTNSLQPNLNMILYSAHDLTLVNILRTLGFEELLKPDYGAALIFELHEINNTNQVNLLYKSNYAGNTKLLEMKSCPTPCYLKDFINQLQPVIPLYWEQECRQNQNSLP